jgi:hypothetical protein
VWFLDPLRRKILRHYSKSHPAPEINRMTAVAGINYTEKLEQQSLNRWLNRKLLRIHANRYFDVVGPPFPIKWSRAKWDAKNPWPLNKTTSWPYNFVNTNNADVVSTQTPSINSQFLPFVMKETLFSCTLVSCLLYVSCFWSLFLACKRKQ